MPPLIRSSHRQAQWPAYLTSGLLVVSAILSWIAFFAYHLPAGGVEKIPGAGVSFARAISSLHWSLRIDTLSAIMLVVVTTISSLVHVYSIGYMSHDPHQPRFFSYLSLFTFAMLMLVTADNLVQLFFGWEGVGLCSYLLIGYWYHRPSANAAAIKAFIVNRVGDFGFALGNLRLLCGFRHARPRFDFAAAPTHVGKTMEFLGADWDMLTTICLLLFMGAMGKSAQFSAAYLASRRHGGPDPRFSPDTRRHHGDCRGLPGGSNVAAV